MWGHGDWILSSVAIKLGVKTMMDSLANLRSTLANLRRFDPEFTILWAELLLTVHKNPGITQSNLQEKCGIKAKSTASRALADVLMIRHGLIRQEENPNNRRERLIFLTAKGERFVQDLEVELQGR
jgi:DNA-binding MarR family transcriptional regulator